MKFTNKTTLYKGKQGNWFFVYTGQKMQGSPPVLSPTSPLRTIMIGTTGRFVRMSSAIELYTPDGGEKKRVFLP